ncbi:hypothetical protein HAU32_10680 [Weissella confusa]|nr:hypothetical protein [Weissella confusa]MBJ7689408.1 hypothetical protein [Weissella confusa]
MPEQLISTWDGDDDEPFLFKLVDDRELVKKTLSILENGGRILGSAEAEPSHGNYLFACPSCYHFTTKFWYKVSGRDEYWRNWELEPFYRCKYCHDFIAKVEVVKQSSKTEQYIFRFQDDNDWIVPCPECHNENFLLLEEGDWD